MLPSLFVLLAVFSAAQAPSTPPARPIACVYDRLERPYLSELWARTMGEGIPDGDPVVRNFSNAGDACRRQFGWQERMVTLSAFYAMARARFETMLEEKLHAEADRILLVRAVQGYAPPNLDVLGRDADNVPFGSTAKVEFRAYLQRTSPDLMRRFDYEDLWSAALPGVVAEIMKVKYALAEALS